MQNRTTPHQDGESSRGSHAGFLPVLQLGSPPSRAAQLRALAQEHESRIRSLQDTETAALTRAYFIDQLILQLRHEHAADVDTDMEATPADAAPANSPRDLCSQEAAARVETEADIEVHLPIQGEVRLVRMSGVGLRPETRRLYAAINALVVGRMASRIPPAAASKDESHGEVEGRGEDNKSEKEDVAKAGPAHAGVSYLLVDSSLAHSSRVTAATSLEDDFQVSATPPMSSRITAQQTGESSALLFDQLAYHPPSIPLPSEGLEGGFPPDDDDMPEFKDVDADNAEEEGDVPPLKVLHTVPAGRRVGYRLNTEPDEGLSRRPNGRATTSSALPLLLSTPPAEASAAAAAATAVTASSSRPPADPPTSATPSPIRRELDYYFPNTTAAAASSGIARSGGKSGISLDEAVKPERNSPFPAVSCGECSSTATAVSGRRREEQLQQTRVLEKDLARRRYIHVEDDDGTSVERAVTATDLLAAIAPVHSSGASDARRGVKRKRSPPPMQTRVAGRSEVGHVRTTDIREVDYDVLRAGGGEDGEGEDSTASRHVQCTPSLYWDVGFPSLPR